MPVQTGPGAHPASCTMDTGSFPGVKSGRGVTLTPHPLLVLWSWKSRAIPLLPRWAVQPVQSLSACTRVTFTFTFTFWNIFNLELKICNIIIKGTYMPKSFTFLQVMVIVSYCMISYKAVITVNLVQLLAEPWMKSTAFQEPSKT
jgi:hypothetical protein